MSFNKTFFQQIDNTLFTPYKKYNFNISSLNNYKNLSSSSEFILERMKNLSNNKYNNNNNTNHNNNPILNNSCFNNIQPKGRKLIVDFNKYMFNKIIENETNILNSNNVHKNNKNISSNYNISNNNNFSFLIPINKKEIEKKTEIINDNKIIISDKNINNNHNIFFTDYGFGFRCNCQKTQCNKYYCQCFRENRYCINCNCVGCNNQKPEFCASNKHDTDEEKKKKNILMSCTCTKSGCNKNYCECYKSKVKCNELCRCINCDNLDEGKFLNNKNRITDYECCLANSIYIIKNEIVVEDLNHTTNNNNNDNDNELDNDIEESPIKNDINIIIDTNFLSSISFEEKEIIGNKRKRNIDNDMNFRNNNIKKKNKQSKSKLNNGNRIKPFKNKKK